MIFRNLLCISLFWATTSAQTLVPDEFFFEYRFFANTKGEANSTDVPLALMLSSLQDHLKDYIASLDKAAIVINSIDYFSRASCKEEEFELDYSDCGSYRSNVVMNIDSDYDPVVVKQIMTRQIQTYLEDGYAAESGNQADAIYDYPKWVQTAVYVELVGVSTPMDEDEMFLFLEEFEEGFRPTMEEDNYDWINNEILYQENMTIPGATLEDEAYNVTKVKMMPKATCSGDSCNNENFYNYLIVNLGEFSDEFLGRLQAIAPNGSDVYYSDIEKIIVRNEQLDIPELPVAEETDTEPKEAGNDKEIPFWSWLFAIICMLVVVCSLGYLCLCFPRRKAMETEKDESGDRVAQRSNHGDEETPL